MSQTLTDNSKTFHIITLDGLPVSLCCQLQSGRIDKEIYDCIVEAIDNWKQPDWYTPLGGAIMIHGHGSASDWTEGCIAVENEVMDILFEYCALRTKITILP